MFQLIVAVISIALIAALAIASIFYGGSAFSGSTGKAQVTSLINQAQQISGAAALYRTDNAGQFADDIAADLVAGNYLQAAPTPPSVATGAWTLTTDGDYAYVALKADAGTFTAVGDEVTKQNGGVAAEDTAVFDAAAVPALGAQFNVVGQATNSAFVFKM